MEAFAFSLIFSGVILALRYLMNQIYDDVTIPKIIVVYFFATTFMSVLSTIRGPIVDGEVPVIRILFFGPYIYTDSAPSLIFASVFTFYGGVTLICAAITSYLSEFIYRKISVFLPKNVRHIFNKFDRELDIKAAKISDNLFFIDDRRGIITIYSLLTIYVLLYLVFLIF